MGPALQMSGAKKATKVVQEGLAPLEDPRNKKSMKFLDKKKANILQQQFSSVYTREPSGEVPVLLARTTSTLETISVLKEMVAEEMRNTKEDKSCGPDEIHPRILKELV